MGEIKPENERKKKNGWMRNVQRQEEPTHLVLHSVTRKAANEGSANAVACSKRVCGGSIPDHARAIASTVHLDGLRRFALVAVVGGANARYVDFLHGVHN